MQKNETPSHYWSFRLSFLSQLNSESLCRFSMKFTLIVYILGLCAAQNPGSTAVFLKSVCFWTKNFNLFLHCDLPGLGQCCMFVCSQRDRGETITDVMTLFISSQKTPCFCIFVFLVLAFLHFETICISLTWPQKHLAFVSLYSFSILMKALP